MTDSYEKRARERRKQQKRREKAERKRQLAEEKGETESAGIPVVDLEALDEDAAETP